MILLGEDIFFRGENPDTRSNREFLEILGQRFPRQKVIFEMVCCNPGCGKVFKKTRENRKFCSLDCGLQVKRMNYNIRRKKQPIEA